MVAILAIVNALPNKGRCIGCGSSKYKLGFHSKSSPAEMITKSAADEVVSNYLRTLEREMNLFGSALPESEDRPPHRLAVVGVQEQDFGWVYIYNSMEFAETGDFLYSLVGNAPVIVDRQDGKLYATGTAKPVEHYLAEFRAGVRHAL